MFQKKKLNASFDETVFPWERQDKFILQVSQPLDFNFFIKFF